MGFGWVQKNVSPIAIDFGADSIKLLQVTLDDPPKLIAAAAIDVPNDARRDAEAQRQFLSQALKDLMREGRFKGRRAVASLNAAHTHVQHVRLPKGEQGQIGPLIENELRGRIPFYPAGIVIRHVMVGDVFTDGQARQEVICFAASREAVLRQVAVAKSAGFDIVGMHGEPMAILAAFGHLFRRTTDVDRTTMFLDIGAATTKVLIAHGNELVFAKTIHVGGDHFTRQYASAMNVDVETARTMRVQQIANFTPTEPPRQPTPADAKHTDTPGNVQVPSGRDRRNPQGGVGSGFNPLDAYAPKTPESEAPASEASETPTAPAAQAATATAPGTVITNDEIMETLVDELQLCLGYHGSVFQNRPVDKVVFLGGESRHLELCQKIAESLGLPAQIGDPLARLVRGQGVAPPTGVDLRQSQPGWAVPMGLCLLPTNL